MEFKNIWLQNLVEGNDYKKSYQKIVTYRIEITNDCVYNKIKD